MKEDPQIHRPDDLLPEPQVIKERAKVSTEDLNRVVRRWRKENRNDWKNLLDADTESPEV